MKRKIFVAMVAMVVTANAAGKQLLWGDTHLHTTYSSDAYTNNNLTAKPDVAYRYARGMPVVHPYHKARVQIETPLDFLVVSDHAELLGGMRSIHRDGVDTSDLGIIDSLLAHIARYVFANAIDKGEGRSLFVSVLPDPDITPREDAQSSLLNSNVSLLPVPRQVEINTWKSITNYADEYNEPGVFTALVGWEWTSIPAGANLHRVVVSDSSGKVAQGYDPFGSDSSAYPEDLWSWLEETSAAIRASGRRVFRGLQHLHLVREDQVTGAAVHQCVLHRQVSQFHVIAVVQYSPAPLGGRLESGGEVHLLEGTRTKHLGFHLPGQSQQRVTVYLGVPDSGQQVGGAGAGDGQTGGRPARGLGVPGTGERRCSLVADADERYLA